MLKRFWLEREGPAADPEPVANASEAPTVPRALAVGLQHSSSALPAIAIYALLAAPTRWSMGSSGASTSRSASWRRSAAMRPS